MATMLASSYSDYKDVPRATINQLVFDALQKSNLTAPEFCDTELLGNAIKSASLTPPRKAKLQLYKDNWYITEAVPRFMDNIKRNAGDADADRIATVSRIVSQIPGTTIFQVNITPATFVSMADFIEKYSKQLLEEQDGKRAPGLDIWLQEFSLEVSPECRNESAGAIVATFMQQPDSIVNKKLQDWLEAGARRTVGGAQIELLQRVALWPTLLERAFNERHRAIGSKCDGTWINGKCIPRPMENAVQRPGDIPSYEKFLKNTQALREDIANLVNKPETSSVARTAPIDIPAELPYNESEVVRITVGSQIEPEVDTVFYGFHTNLASRA